MKDKLNKEFRFTWWNILKIIIPIVLIQVIGIGSVIVNDHYNIKGNSKDIKMITRTLDKKADAQDLAEYIKLEKLRYDLTCQITTKNEDNIMKYIDEINKRIDRLEHEIFQRQSFRGSGTNDTNYFLKHGISLVIRAGFWQGDYCKPTPLL